MVNAPIHRGLRSPLTLPGDVPPEVPPVGVHLLDQANLPGAAPLFQLLFAGDGGRCIVMRIVPDQSRDAVALGEAFEPPLTVLPDAADRVAGDTNIERAVLPARKDIDNECLRPHAATAAWMASQVTM